MGCPHERSTEVTNSLAMSASAITAAPPGPSPRPGRHSAYQLASLANRLVDTTPWSVAPYSRDRRPQS